jgi:hypothetical protein
MAGKAEIVLGGRSLPIPSFFPSVSSVKTNLTPLDYVRVLNAIGEHQFLVSAHDLARVAVIEREPLKQALDLAVARGATVLLDSGNYESFWKEDDTWGVGDFAAILAETPASLAFCFDDQTPPDDPTIAAAGVIAAVDRDQAAARHATICPIVHGRVDILPTTVHLAAQALQPIVLAVAERELGDGIVARSKTVRRLRDILDRVAPRTALHLLGTGNPLAILAYAIAGADSFDGLEWCQTCVDPDAIHLHHFQHRDLVRTLEPSIISTLPYAGGTLAHNLFFYRQWMQRLRESLACGTALALLQETLPRARRAEVTGQLALLERPVQS